MATSAEGAMLFWDASVVINSVDLSDHVRSVGFRAAGSDIDIEAMGDKWANNLAGIRNIECVIDFWQDFYTSQVDATLEPLYSADTQFTITVFADKTSGVSATNPSYAATFRLPAYSPIDGAHGEALSTSVTFRSTGGGTTGYTRATS